MEFKLNRIYIIEYPQEDLDLQANCEHFDLSKKTILDQRALTIPF